MFKLFKNLFDVPTKKLKKYQKVVDQINDLEADYKALSDDDLAGKTQEFKALISEKMAKFHQKNSQDNFDTKDDYQQALHDKEQEVLGELLPDAFATVRETSRRVIGLRHFDVQILAGIALHYGNVTEQKTGEGKTLTVTCPLYLNSLLEKGVHLVTVNDYLAEIGVGWMGPIYEFLGLRCAVLVHDESKVYNSEVESEPRGDERLEHFEKVSRREAYRADITYGTNNEFGFDYLRDNMVQSLEAMVQRQEDDHFFAIIDEADSILIDEARTPLIISAPDNESTRKYHKYAKMVKSLAKDQDYKIDEKSKSVTLTDLGVKRIEQKLGVDNLYEESFDTIHQVESALKARSLYHRDQDYIVRDDQVIIVDEHTGRLMYGRRYSDGLHQAIEAKENVEIQQESRTLATISIQNYFRLYEKLSGMTGTAATEAAEFKEIYDSDVLVIPTHKPVVRDDKSDVVYKTTAAKYSAIVNRVEEIHEAGQPILIGTRSIENNQIISNFLDRKNIKHNILNAKNHEKEAFIIADAGKKGAITVATNIAGRGVDIVLGGAKPELKDYRQKDDDQSKEKPNLKEIEENSPELNLPINIDVSNYDVDAYVEDLKEWKKNHDKVVEVGGLYVIGTERHESRRIDNQLRGRSGRQGDPGVSQFFVALDDDIMRIFGGDQIARVMDFLNIDENQPIEHKMVSKSIESAQSKVESHFFDQRKRLVEFDDVMNKQREIIYRRRRRLLEQSSQGKDDKQQDLEIKSKVVEKKSDANETLKEQVLTYIKNEVESIAVNFDAKNPEESAKSVINKFVEIIPFDNKSQNNLAKKLAENKSIDGVISQLNTIVDKTYQAREEKLGRDNMGMIERLVTLSTIDKKWMDHLDEMENLKDGIWLRGDQQTVLSEYKKEAFVMFESLIKRVEGAIARKIFRIQPVGQNIEQEVQPKIPDKIRLEKEDIHESLPKEIKDAQVPSSNKVPSKITGDSSDLASALGSAKTGSKPRPGSKKVKIGRNDPCPCGSGKKYKKCCLLKEFNQKRS